MDLAPIPLFDPVARSVPERPGGVGQPVYMTDTWSRYFTDLKDKIAAGTRVIGTVALAGQGASIAPTAINLASLTAGLYRLTYYLRITTAGAAGSTIQVVWTWTESTVALSANMTTVAATATTVSKSESYMVLADALAPILYSTVYVSVPAAQMKHNLYIVVEAVSV